MNMHVIDAHCHVGRGIMNELDAQILLNDMDRLGIQQAVIVPWDQAIAVYNEAGNNYMVELSEEYPERFIPFCTVNPWYETKAIEELKRAIGAGCKGLKLHPVYQGFQLTDPIVKPILKLAVEAQVIIYIPTGTPVMNMPLQLKYWAEMFPEGIFIQGHFGSTDFWIDAIPSVVDCPNVSVDTAYNMVSSVENAIRHVGVDRVIYSSDAPYLGMESELEKIGMLSVSGADKAKILSGNITRLLKGGR
jgi:predicted TIM-barrel fold metal-dependent hydrolase